MERELAVIQALNQPTRHRMAELALGGWRFSLKPKVMAGGGWGWMAEHRDHPTRYSQTLYTLLCYVNNIYLEP